MPIDDGVGRLLSRDHLLDGIHGQDVRHALVIVDRICGPRGSGANEIGESVRVVGTKLTDVRR
jgi:hypothetical protein